MEAVVEMLGILKAGGAYLPIDPKYPLTRIKTILQDSGAAILLTSNSEFDGAAFGVDTLHFSESSFLASGRLRLSCSPGSLAYVIYTSGSTGRPKGVMIEHRGLVNYCWWAHKQYMHHSDKFALYSSLSFDLTVTSVFVPLISGNQIVVYHENSIGEHVLFQIVADRKATVVKLTPSHLSILNEMDLSDSTIRTLIVGGEELKTNVAEKTFEKLGRKLLMYNEYGPTEAVVGCMLYQYTGGIREKTVPIGRPADNVRIYILGDDLKHLPIGAVGELYIASDGVARGYLNQPELTAERFLPSQFAPGTKMYRTGDLARVRMDGEVEYLGRNDTQVKIRGFRIELGEIEALLMAHPGVLTAVVDVLQSCSDKYVIAYCVTDLQVVPDFHAIQQYMREHVPDYMVPSRIYRVSDIPLTTNG